MKNKLIELGFQLSLEAHRNLKRILESLYIKKIRYKLFFHGESFGMEHLDQRKTQTLKFLLDEIGFLETKFFPNFTTQSVSLGRNLFRGDKILDPSFVLSVSSRRNLFRGSETRNT